MVAADLDLPVPEPFLVQLNREFIETWTDAEVQALALRSIAIGFGSKKLPNGFSTWPTDKTIPPHLRTTAAEILAFDALILNDDRRPGNPNCLSNGTSIAIIDHELSFMIEGVIGRRPPWEVGSLEHLQRPRAHLFSDDLRGRGTNLDRFVGAWESITDARLVLRQISFSRCLFRSPPLPPGEGGGEGDHKVAYKLPLILSFSRREKEHFVLGRKQGMRKNLSDGLLAEYRAALPQEWAGGDNVAEKILGYITKVRDNIQPAVAEILRVLA